MIYTLYGYVFYDNKYKKSFVFVCWVCIVANVGAVATSNRPFN